MDKNPLAAEMAKLSLWLLTLAKNKPFEFLDHAIRCGDSLVGIHNTEQLRKFDLDGKGEDNRLFLGFLDEKIKEAIALRRQITEMQANRVEDVEAQDRMLREANDKIERLKCAADMLIAAEFTPGSAADKREARDDAAIMVADHFNDSDLPTFRQEAQKAMRPSDVPLAAGVSRSHSRTGWVRCVRGKSAVPWKQVLGRTICSRFSEICRTLYGWKFRKD